MFCLHRVAGAPCRRQVAAASSGHVPRPLWMVLLTVPAMFGLATGFRGNEECAPRASAPPSIVGPPSRGCLNGAPRHCRLDTDSVDTGALSRSVTAHDGGTVTIEGTGEQGPQECYDIVETGRESGPLRHAPQPYLRPAAGLLMTQVGPIARQEIARAVAVEVARMRGGQRQAGSGSLPSGR